MKRPEGVYLDFKYNREVRELTPEEAVAEWDVSLGHAIAHRHFEPVPDSITLTCECGYVTKTLEELVAHNAEQHKPIGMSDNE